ncbi:MAG: heavy-metal-associated domain-containing protein, partial [Candidatus Fimimonas sp.]
HCTARVQKALLCVDGVSQVEVSLENKCATVTACENVSAQTLKNAVEAQDYTVVSVEEI